MMYWAGFGLFGWFGMMLFWALFIWFIVWLIRQNQDSSEVSAISILKQRYARGEITKKQYNQIKSDLS
ncbi:SHOCT domain-containing protein [Candidatus Woesearchaeota archaeon]|nr:SHOCT domain-containing protein [Candidatus Woesearchaeota archaeon]